MGPHIWRHLLRTHTVSSFPDVNPHLVQLILGGKDVMVVLTSAEAVRDVLEKQSAATASRPPSYLDHVLHDGKYIVMAPYCEPVLARAATLST
jgi:hypothetical protein